MSAAVFFPISFLAVVGFFEQKGLIEMDAVLKIENKAAFEAAIAKAEKERYQGLSGVENMKPERGKLFIHSEKDFHSYVMRDMFFSLDFVFIDGNKIIDIKETIPKDFSGKVRGDFKYDKVLELKAGVVKEKNIKIGDKISVVSS